MTCIVCGREDNWGNTKIDVWDYNYTSHKKRTIELCNQHCREIDIGLDENWVKRQRIIMDRYEMANLLAFMSRHKEHWNGDWEGQIRQKLSIGLYCLNTDYNKLEETTNFGDRIPTNTRYSAYMWSGNFDKG